MNNRISKIKKLISFAFLLLFIFNCGLKTKNISRKKFNKILNDHNLVYGSRVKYKNKDYIFNNYNSKRHTLYLITEEKDQVIAVKLDKHNLVYLEDSKTLIIEEYQEFSDSDEDVLDWGFSETAGNDEDEKLEQPKKELLQKNVVPKINLEHSEKIWICDSCKYGNEFKDEVCLICRRGNPSITIKSYWQNNKTSSKINSVKNMLSVNSINEQVKNFIHQNKILPKTKILLGRDLAKYSFQSYSCLKNVIMYQDSSGEFFSRLVKGVGRDLNNNLVFEIEEENQINTNSEAKKNKEDPEMKKKIENYEKEKILYQIETEIEILKNKKASALNISVFSNVINYIYRDPNSDQVVNRKIPFDIWLEIEKVYIKNKGKKIYFKGKEYSTFNFKENGYITLSIVKNKEKISFKVKNVYKTKYGLVLINDKRCHKEYISNQFLINLKKVVDSEHIDRVNLVKTKVHIKDSSKSKIYPLLLSSRHNSRHISFKVPGSNNLYLPIDPKYFGRTNYTIYYTVLENFFRKFFVKPNFYKIIYKYLEKSASELYGCQIQRHIFVKPIMFRKIKRFPKLGMLLLWGDVMFSLYYMNENKLQTWMPTKAIDFIDVNEDSQQLILCSNNNLEIYKIKEHYLALLKEIKHFGHQQIYGLTPFKEIIYSVRNPKTSNLEINKLSTDSFIYQKIFSIHKNTFIHHKDIIVGNSTNRIGIAILGVYVLEAKFGVKPKYLYSGLLYESFYEFKFNHDDSKLLFNTKSGIYILDISSGISRIIKMQNEIGNPFLSICSKYLIFRDENTDQVNIYDIDQEQIVNTIGHMNPACSKYQMDANNIFRNGNSQLKFTVPYYNEINYTKDGYLILMDTKKYYYEIRKKSI